VKGESVVNINKKLEKDFDSDIEYLVKNCNKNTVFLSDWNKWNDSLDFPENIVKRAVSNYSHKNLYTFSEEIEDIKKEYAPRFSSEDYTIEPEEYTVVSNATIGGFLSLNAIRKQLGSKIHALLITPVYFVYINVLRDLALK
jgi:formyltetrahydrofolate synthetase